MDTLAGNVRLRGEIEHAPEIRRAVARIGPCSMRELNDAIRHDTLGDVQLVGWDQDIDKAGDRLAEAVWDGKVGGVTFERRGNQVFFKREPPQIGSEWKSLDCFASRVVVAVVDGIVLWESCGLRGWDTLADWLAWAASARRIDTEDSNDT